MYKMCIKIMKWNPFFFTVSEKLEKKLQTLQSLVENLS